MTLEQFAAVIADSKQHSCLYHFTDRRNLAGIRQHGLLSMQRVKLLEAPLVAPGGNDWSIDADAHCGMDKYVHLCFCDNHPMEYLARSEGRLESTVFLRINPEILNVAGVLLTNAVSNKSGVVPATPEKMLGSLDLGVIYQRMDWRLPDVMERLKAARLYEILVPNCVPPEMILNLNG
jgi:hypothetical protein